MSRQWDIDQEAKALARFIGWHTVGEGFQLDDEHLCKECTEKAREALKRALHEGMRIGADEI